MPISVRLSRIPSNVTQPLHPRPRFIKLRIAVTLLGPAADRMATDDVARLAAQPDVQRTSLDRKCHDDPIAQLRPSPEATRLIFEIERSARDHFKTDRVHQIQPAVLLLARSRLDMESVPEHEGDRNAKDQAKQDGHLDALLAPTELGGVCRELRRNQ